MNKFENNILGFVPKEDWLDVGLNVTRPNDPVDQLFGDEKTDNLVAKWASIAAQYQVPMMAMFHAFDTEAQKTVRIPIDVHNIEKGLIKVKIDQTERMLALLDNGVQDAQALYDYVINDGVMLADQVVTRSKVAKNEALATGKVTIKENNLDLTVDYGVPAANLAYEIDFGAGAEEDVPAQLEAIIAAIKATGAVPTGIYTSAAVTAKFRRNAAIQQAVNGNIGAGSIVRKADFNAYMADEYGLTRIIENDLTYNVPAGIGADGRPAVTNKRYYPNNKITFICANPNGRVGTGLWGNPPEVRAARFMDVAGSAVSPYVYISQWAENDPAVLWTKASGLFMPVIYNPNTLFVATATETAGT